jgi:hypothetical protein
MNFDGTEYRNWIKDPTALQKRLLINGRLLTYNLRGGSLNSSLQALGNGQDIGTEGKCANGSSTHGTCSS